jgi:amino acid permease
MKAKKHDAQQCAQKRTNRKLAKALRRAEIRQRTRSELKHTNRKTKKRLKDRFILINVIGGTISNTLIAAAQFGADSFEDIDFKFFGLCQNFLLQLVGA